MYKSITLLYTWNQYNIVNQLYFKIKLKLNDLLLKTQQTNLLELGEETNSENANFKTEILNHL